MGIDANGEPIKCAQVCYMCAGERQRDNKNYYVQKRDNGKCQLSSDWHHKQQNSKAPPNNSMAARQSERALLALQQKMERKGDAERLPSATEVAEHLKNGNMRRAIDWVNKIGPETYIIYGHYKCTKQFLIESQTDNPDLATAAAMSASDKKVAMRDLVAKAMQ